MSIKGRVGAFQAPKIQVHRVQVHKVSLKPVFEINHDLCHRLCCPSCPLYRLISPCYCADPGRWHHPRPRGKGERCAQGRPSSPPRKEHHREPIPPEISAIHKHICTLGWRPRRIYRYLSCTDPRVSQGIRRV